MSKKIQYVTSVLTFVCETDLNIYCAVNGIFSIFAGQRSLSGFYQCLQNHSKISQIVWFTKFDLYITLTKSTVAYVCDFNVISSAKAFTCGTNWSQTPHITLHFILDVFIP